MSKTAHSMARVVSGSELSRVLASGRSAAREQLKPRNIFLGDSARNASVKSLFQDWMGVGLTANRRVRGSCV
jgi:hypothetical protein